jgi:pimeloyl-ACP methyl ester carboxylesterase
MHGVSAPRAARKYQTARVAGVELHYDLADYTDPWRGKPAETFLLYPGYCRNVEFWHAWVPLLGRAYRVLRMDPAGYGYSTQPPAGYQYDAERSVREALALMDHLDIERVHWVGESTGGKIGMLAALLAPQRIASLSACNTTAKTATQTVDAYALGEADQAAALQKYGVGEWCSRTLHYRVSASRMPPGLGEWVAREMGRVPRHLAISAFQCFSKVDLWPRLAEIQAPTLLILGEDCPENRRMQLAEMSRLLPRGKLVRLDGYDFGIHFLAPGRCVAAIRQFLEERAA